MVPLLLEPTNENVLNFSTQKVYILEVSGTSVHCFPLKNAQMYGRNKSMSLIPLIQVEYGWKRLKIKECITQRKTKFQNSFHFLVSPSDWTEGSTSSDKRQATDFR